MPEYRLVNLNDILLRQKKCIDLCRALRGLDAEKVKLYVTKDLEDDYRNICADSKFRRIVGD